MTLTQNEKHLVATQATLQDRLSNKEALVQTIATRRDDIRSAFEVEIRAFLEATLRPT